MADDDDDKGGEVLSFLANRGSARRPQLGNEPTAGDIYATVMGQRSASVLRFIRRSGKPFSMPYALLPIVWGDYLPGVVLMEYPGLFTVRLRGKGLEPLEEHLSERRVTWIRACDQAAATPLPLAVTGIDLLRTYPSREISQDLAAIGLEETEPA